MLKKRYDEHEIASKTLKDENDELKERLEKLKAKYYAEKKKEGNVEISQVNNFHGSTTS